MKPAKNKKSENGNKIMLQKEDWLAAAQRVHTTAFIIAKWLADNPESRGQEDTENVVADMQLACQAMRYVAENANDKCSVIPMPKG